MKKLLIILSYNVCMLMSAVHILIAAVDIALKQWVSAIFFFVFAFVWLHFARKKRRQYRDLQDLPDEVHSLKPSKGGRMLTREQERKLADLFLEWSDGDRLVPFSHAVEGKGFTCEEAMEWLGKVAERIAEAQVQR